MKLEFEGELDCDLCKPTHRQRRTIILTIEGYTTQIVCHGPECGHEWILIRHSASEHED